MKVPHGNKSASVSRSDGGSCFLCFKPLSVEIDRVTDKVSLYPPERRRRNDVESFLLDRESKIDSREGKGPRRRGFTRAVMAVLFRPKKGRNPESRIGSESSRSDSSCSFRYTKRKHDSDSKTGLTKSSSMRSTSSTSSCLSSQPSESPSIPIMSSSKPNPKPPKQSRSKEQSSVIIGLLLILSSLTLTIFWGKIWAIGLNAIYLYLAPSSRRGPELEVAHREVERVESSRELRRRVIMEGLLDRRHYHHHHHHQNCQQQ